MLYRTLIDRSGVHGTREAEEPAGTRFGVNSVWEMDGKVARLKRSLLELGSE